MKTIIRMKTERYMYSITKTIKPMKTELYMYNNENDLTDETGTIYV